MRSPALSPLALALAALAPQVDAQTCRLACDINRIGTPLSSSPYGARSGPGPTWAPDFVKCGKAWFFVATTTAAGQELWKTDGTPGGTVMVKDIRPGFASSSISLLTCCGKKVFFRADDGVSGAELWVSDGTAAGTRMVKDIHPGGAGSTPFFLECLGNKVVFAANDGASGHELWISDGTVAGTTILKDIRSGPLSSTPHYMKANSAGNAVYFAAFDPANGVELWKTDGTTAGTVLIKDILAGPSHSSPTYFNNVGGRTVFRARGASGHELWVTDGTAAGTTVLKDIRPGPASSDPNLFYSPTARIGNRLYFSANDGAKGIELWETDGTAAGTRLVADVRPGFPSSSPSYMVAVGTTLFFRAYDNRSGFELFKYSGGAVTLVKDIRPGGSSSFPTDLAALGTNRVVFSANDGKNGTEPWVSDGTTAGTVLLKDLRPGSDSSSPKWFTALGPNRLLFAANSATNGQELFLTAGTPAGTSLFKDLQPGNATQSSKPSNLACAWGSTLYLGANDGKNGHEPWIHDVATGKCTMLGDVRPGPAGSSPSFFTPLWTGRRALVVFSANDGTNGTELWFSDGTAPGTMLFKDIRPGPPSSSPSDLTVVRGLLCFAADDGAHGTELWVSDGTAPTTRMLKDVRTGPAGSDPIGLTACAARLYFAANDGTHGAELWVSDGTAAGTTLLKDIGPGSLGSSPSHLTCHHGRLVFRANDGTHGAELWVSDGTAPGTTMVKDIRPGAWSASPSHITSCGRLVFFAADDGTHGAELWVSDLTAAGTRMVKDIHPGARASSPSYLTCVGDRVYFSAFVAGSGGGSGRELWVSDGTAAGTKQVCDIHKGGSSSSPSYLTVCSGRLFFSAYEPIKGRELHVVELPGAAVERLGEGCAPTFPTLDSTPPRLGATAVLTSGSGPAAHVGFLVLGPSAGRPSLMPFSPPCALWLDIVNGPVVPIGGPAPAPGFTRSLPIPNQPGLEGGKVMLQTLWLNAGSRFPIKGSNGVQLTIGK